MKRTVKTLVVDLLVAALCMIPMGCGGGEGDPGTTDGVSTFRLGSSTAFDTMNPLSSYMAVTYEFFMLIYDPLVSL